MNPDTFRIRVDGQIRFEYATCGWKYFFNPEINVVDSKISGYVCTGP